MSEDYELMAAEAPAWAEYRHATHAAWVECERAVSEARARFGLVGGPAWAKLKLALAEGRAAREVTP